MFNTCYDNTIFICHRITYFLNGVLQGTRHNRTQRGGRLRRSRDSSAPAAPALWPYWQWVGMGLWQGPTSPDWPALWAEPLTQRETCYSLLSHSSPSASDLSFLTLTSTWMSPIFLFPNLNSQHELFVSSSQPAVGSHAQPWSSKGRGVRELWILIKLLPWQGYGWGSVTEKGMRHY